MVRWKKKGFMKIAKHLKSVDYSPINDVRIIYQKLSNNILCTVYKNRSNPKY